MNKTKEPIVSDLVTIAKEFSETQREELSTRLFDLMQETGITITDADTLFIEIKTLKTNADVLKDVLKQAYGFIYELANAAITNCINHQLITDMNNQIAKKDEHIDRLISIIERKTSINNNLDLSE